MLKYNKLLFLKLLLRLQNRIKLFNFYYELKSGIITPSPKNNKNTFLPNTIYVDIGSHCDGNCIDGCYVPKKDRSQNIALSELNIKDILNTAKDISVNYLTILGGEPFSSVNFGKTFKLINENPYLRFSVCTNGINLCNKGIIEQTRALINLNIVFSIDGFEETNDFLRGAGAFKSSVFALKNYSENGKRLAGVIVTLRKMNLTEATTYDFIKMMSDLGAYFIVYCVKFDRDEDVDMETIDFKNAIANLMKYSIKLPVALLTNMYGQIYKNRINLANRVQSINVNYKGDVCTARPGIAIDNINNNKLLSIIKSNKIQSMLRKKHIEYDENYVSNDDPRYLRLFKDTITLLKADGVKFYY